ncbi:hypothetical protein C1H76_7956 [Elsinoe australis]|uniref:Aminoglycoside phosphotransferase domain-containing protein n=1 Tax=Elsinoe australis TaxID=40998 RepID=A0A4U7ANQ0_9PEZI|nr:hypothetical protein C1H76_7956 [Elsinoe australis]
MDSTDNARGIGAKAELFEYTHGRWLWNDARNRASRRRTFNEVEFRRLAALSIGRESQDIIDFRKLGEGGFNRTFMITFRDGYKLVGRIPFLTTEPRSLLVASEVATLDFLRMHKFPVPQIFAYSTTADNSAETEYMFMECVKGTKLGDIWDQMKNKDRNTLLTEIVEVEARWMSLPYPESGSLYYEQDLPKKYRAFAVAAPSLSSKGDFCIGPDLTSELWYGKRIHLDTFRGPYQDSTDVLNAAGRNELEYLTRFGKSVLPLRRMRRETFDCKEQSPQDQIKALNAYLRLAHHLVPSHNPSLLRPTLRHPDLSPNNIFVSDKYEITGFIDWQHSAILPLFLHCGIPGSFQNHGDPMSETLQMPELPLNFAELDEREQCNETELLKKRQTHYYYMVGTSVHNQPHLDALWDDTGNTRRRPYLHAREPWEGDAISLKADLIRVVQRWPEVVKSDSLPCPISFSDQEIQECLRLEAEQEEADSTQAALIDIVGCGQEGWVPAEHYDEALDRAKKLKEQTLGYAESEEEREIALQHWVMDDYDDEDYK